MIAHLKSMLGNDEKDKVICSACVKKMYDNGSCPTMNGTRFKKSKEGGVVWWVIAYIEAGATSFLTDHVVPNKKKGRARKVTTRVVAKRQKLASAVQPVTPKTVQQMMTNGWRPPPSPNDSTDVPTEADVAAQAQSLADRWNN